jgi:uncharacterized protein YqeY
MSSLKEKIRSDLLLARQNGEQREANLLRTILGEFDRTADREISDDTVRAVLIKFQKSLNEVREHGDEVTQAEADIELELIGRYLPREATEQELLALLYEVKPANKGAWMGVVKNFAKQHGVIVDNRAAAQLFDRG